jgi:hypothetical protein
MVCKKADRAEGVYEEVMGIAPERTRLTSHVHTIADTLRAAVGTIRLGAYMAAMTVPDQTTNGGLHELQHLCLRPKTGMSIVIGSVNVIRKTVEVRSFAEVTRMCVRRFNQGPCFGEDRYNAFIGRAQTVFSNFGLEMRIIDAVVASPEPPPAKRKMPLFGWILAATTFAGVGVGALVSSFLH